MEMRGRRSPGRVGALPRVASMLYQTAGGRIRVVLDLKRKSRLLERPRHSLSPLLNSQSLLRLESAVGRHHSASKLPSIQPRSNSKPQIAAIKAEMSRFDEDRYRLIRKRNRSRYHTSGFKPAVFRLWRAEMAAKDLSLQRL